MKSAHLNYLIAGLALLFCVLVFKGISYPLLWNDESETVMTADHILKFGYPKMHDGKNFIFLPDGGKNGDTWIGYKASADANITMPWGQYYFAAIGVFLAERVNDLHLKGGIIRSTFAVMGLLGLGLFLLSLRDFFPDRRLYQWVVAAFIFMELFSVALLLHLREARYYSLVIFIVSCFFYVFIRHGMGGRYSAGRYTLLMTAVLFFAYQINVAAFLSCCLTLGLYEAVRQGGDIVSLMKAKGWTSADLWRQAKRAAVPMAPVLICVALITPFLIFFETFSTAASAEAHFKFGWTLYVAHLRRIYHVFSTQDLLHLMILVKIIQIAGWWRSRGAGSQSKNGGVGLWKREKLSVFITVYGLCFCGIIARMPFPMIWTRYVIVLQPVLILILLLDAVCILVYIRNGVFGKWKSLMRVAFAGVLLLGLMINMQGARIAHVGDYLYQITHPLKGPLDFIIPCIIERFRNPESIIVATNYKELSYVYYLHCKVILGGINKNFEEDMKMQPDVIVFRKAWGQNPDPYIQLLQQAQYERVIFPVYDSAVNNVAEMDYKIQHQFKTRMAEEGKEKAIIFIRE